MSYRKIARYRKQMTFALARRAARRAMREEAHKARFTKDGGCMDISFAGVHAARVLQARRAIRAVANRHSMVFVGDRLQ